jgi:hypothetical protein
VVGTSGQGIKMHLTTRFGVPTSSAESTPWHRLMLGMVRLAAEHDLILGPGTALLVAAPTT